MRQNDVATLKEYTSHIKHIVQMTLGQLKQLHIDRQINLILYYFVDI